MTSPTHLFLPIKLQRGRGRVGERQTATASPRGNLKGSRQRSSWEEEEKSSAMVVGASRSALRKGPWTEQEDLQLVWFVGLFGERRWDFLAKVSGLNRTGKSCRLRWVNYLHPGLKRGRMTTQEEQLVLELHAKWGNRWSRIARKLPGRTDNEIKNYWRTHMRKKAQEEKRGSSPSSPSSFSSSNVYSSNSEAPSEVGPEKHECDSKEGSSSLMTGSGEDEEGVKGYQMDQLWKEIAASEPVCEMSFEEYSSGDYNLSCHSMPSPMWEYCSETLWRIDDEEYKMFIPDLSNS